MYDELIRDSALRSGLEPLLFVHPVEQELLALFAETVSAPTSVILTGTAGDGKTHLCRRVWEQLEVVMGNGDQMMLTFPLTKS